MKEAMAWLIWPIVMMALIYGFILYPCFKQVSVGMNNVNKQLTMMKFK
jgi:hypothetical protein